MISFAKLHERTRPLIIAHRGASAVEHENTLAAFERAIALGADAIEFDIRRTADGVLVVHHDRSIGPGSRPISRLSLDQCRKKSELLGYSVPTLTETLQFCAGKIALDIELKEAGYEEQVLKTVSEYYRSENVAFTSFRLSSLLRLREIDPTVITGLLAGFVPYAISESRLSGLSSLVRLRRSGADFLAPNWQLMRFGILNRAAKRAVPVIAWTVNRSPSARRLARLGVAGIITDYPDRIRAAIETPKKRRRPRPGRRRRSSNPD